MKKLLFTLTIAVITMHNLFAQNTRLAAPDSTINYKNHLFAEIGGSGLGLSINYERFLSKSPGGFSVRVGIGFGVVPGLFNLEDQYYSSIPLGFSYNLPISNNKHNFFEIGSTYTIIGGNALGNNRFLSVITGWRHTTASGKTQLRVSLLPYLVALNTSDHTNHALIGFSIGHRFN